MVVVKALEVIDSHRAFGLSFWFMVGQ